MKLSRCHGRLWEFTEALNLPCALVFSSIYRDSRIGPDKLSNSPFSKAMANVTDCTLVPLNYLLLPFLLDTDIFQPKHFLQGLMVRFLNTTCREYGKPYLTMLIIQWANYIPSIFLTSSRGNLILWTSDMNMNNQDILLSKKRITLYLCLFGSLSLINFRKAFPTLKC